MKSERLIVKALFQALEGESKQIEIAQEVVQFLDALHAMALENTALRTVFEAPHFSDEEKKSALKVFSEKSGFSGFAEQFGSLVIEKGHFSKIRTLKAHLEEEIVRKKGEVPGLLEVADEIGEQDRMDLEALFSTRTKKKVRLRVSVKPELIAGVRVHLDGRTYDASLKGRLSSYRERIHKEANSIQ